MEETNLDALSDVSSTPEEVERNNLIGNIKLAGAYLDRLEIDAKENLMKQAEFDLYQSMAAVLSRVDTKLTSYFYSEVDNLIFRIRYKDIFVVDGLQSIVSKYLADQGHLIDLLDDIHLHFALHYPRSFKVMRDEFIAMSNYVHKSNAEAERYRKITEEQPWVFILIACFATFNLNYRYCIYARMTSISVGEF